VSEEEAGVAEKMLIFERMAVLPASLFFMICSPAYPKAAVHGG
jgi:hypothetical protein